jgi:hypothetical protein
MKLWVAEDVLSDHTSEITIIYAKSEEEAIDVLFRDSPFNAWVLYNYPECDCHRFEKQSWSETLSKYHRPDRLPKEFKEIKHASAISLSGGG